MMRPTLDELAMQYVLLRARSLQAKSRRNSHRCRSYAPYEHDTGYSCPKCWETPPDGVPALPHEEWCDECKASQQEHDAYLAASKEAAKVWRRIASIIRKAGTTC